MAKKNLNLIIIVMTVLVMGFAVVEKAKSCSQMNDYNDETYQVSCPGSLCSGSGSSCSYCSGTGAANMPCGGGSSTTWTDSTFDCGSWWTGTCTAGTCNGTVLGGSCVESEQVASC